MMCSLRNSIHPSYLLPVSWHVNGKMIRLIISARLLFRFGVGEGRGFTVDAEGRE